MVGYLCWIGLQQQAVSDLVLILAVVTCQLANPGCVSETRKRDGGMQCSDGFAWLILQFNDPKHGVMPFQGVEKAPWARRMTLDDLRRELHPTSHPNIPNRSSVMTFSEK